MKKKKVEEKAKTSLVKVGDILRVTEDSVYGTNLLVGDRVKVSIVRSEKNWTAHPIHDEADTWSFDDQALDNGIELVGAEATPGIPYPSEEERKEANPLFMSVDGLSMLNMSKRDIFAILALHGMITDPNTNHKYPEIIQNARKLADGLVAELDKK